jgi:DNA-binding PadR family transcriptional regulator
MPPRASHLPNHLERNGLQKLLGGRELPATKLHPTGAQTIKTMVAKGWIERGSSERVYRITPAGEAAVRAPLPMTKGNRPATG